MADADIITRLKLNATEFRRGLDQALDGAEARSKGASRQIAANLGEGLGEGLRGFSAQVPLIGGQLAALNGPALAAGAGIAALALAFTKGVAEAESFARATRGLDAVLAATGNKTGQTRDQLVGFAEDLEGVFAVPAEEIIAAQQQLATFDGIAGTTFNRTIRLAGDLAATFGTDIGGSAEKLGTVLQNLAQGEVDGLSRGFRFLGANALETVEALAKAGDTAGAQEALLAALEARIGGAGAAGGQGLSGAFFNLSDAVSDAARELATSSGAYEGTISLVNGLTAALNRLSGAVPTSSEGIAAEVTRRNAQALRLRSQIAPLPDGVGLDLRRELAETEKRINVLIAAGRKQVAEREAGDRASRAAVEAARAEGEARRAVEEAEKRALEVTRERAREAKSAADAAQREAQAAARRETALAESLASLEQRAALALETRIEQDKITAALQLQNQVGRELSAEEEKRLRFAVEARAQNEALAERLQTAPIDVDTGADLKAFEAEIRAREAAQKELAEAQRADIRELADFYERSFSDGAGSVWKQFRNLGRRALAELAAQLTTQLLGGASTGGGLGGLLGGVFGGLGGGGGTRGGGLGGIASSISGLGGLFGGGAASGAAGALAGSGSAFSGFGAQAASFAGLGSAGGAGAAGAASAAASAVPYVAAAFAAFEAGKLLANALTTRRGSASIGSVGGELAVTGTRGNSRSRESASRQNAEGILSTLAEIADALGGELTGTGAVSIGIRKNSFRVDTSGQGRTKTRNGAVDFGDDEQAAVEFAVRDLILDGAIGGLSAAQATILREGKDLQKAIEQAVAVGDITKRLRAIDDPLGAAIDDLNAEFETLIEALDAGRASAEDYADAERLYGIERDRLVEQYGQSADELKAFRDSLAFGSSSPLSARDQQLAARQSFEAQAATIGTAGFDSAEFTEAGQAYLDAVRAVEGSTAGFFREFDRVQALTNQAISAVDNAQVISASNPFAERTANAAAATADNTAELSRQVAALPQQIGAAVAASLGTGGGFSAASSRGFARAR